MTCRDGLSKSNTILGSAANVPETVGRKSLRDRVVIRDYLGLCNTDFDERPSEPVLIYGESGGPTQKSWRILSKQILPDQG